jgi:flavodoxin
LLVYYSRTGNTRTLAELVAAQMPCDVEELIDTQSRSGVWGYLRSGLDAILHTRTRLKPVLHNPMDYDLVIVGTPKWVNVSTPVRSYLAAHPGQFKQVAFFLTQDGTTGSGLVFRQMARLCGRSPTATLAVRREDLVTGKARTMARDFAGALGSAGAVAPALAATASEPAP